MNTLHHIDAWIRTDAPVVRGRPFPYGEFSCTPLHLDSPEGEDNPVFFLLSRGNEITWVEPSPTGEHSRLWDTLIEEMRHWKIDKSAYLALPPECWYG